MIDKCEIKNPRKILFFAFLYVFLTSFLFFAPFLWLKFYNFTLRLDFYFPIIIIFVYFYKYEKIALKKIALIYYIKFFILLFFYKVFNIFFISILYSTFYFPKFKAETTEFIKNFVFDNFFQIQGSIYVYFVGPVFEELFFRKLLYDFLFSFFSKFLGEKISKMLPIFLISICFGLIHYSDRPLLYTIVPFLNSLFLFFLKEKTGDWKPGILAHILLNADFL